jgi:Lecithin retinol acyltransferase
MNAPTRPASPAPLPATACEPFALGAHLVTPRRGYTHHGIYVGGNRVVHYAGWSRAALTCRPVEEVSLEQFADGRSVAVLVDGPVHFSPTEVVARARSRLGEDRYRVASNNCEHFCHWCLTGENRSAQVERVFAWLHASVMWMTRRPRIVFEQRLHPSS